LIWPPPRRPKTYWVHSPHLHTYVCMYVHIPRRVQALVSFCCLSTWITQDIFVYIHVYVVHLLACRKYHFSFGYYNGRHYVCMYVRMYVCMYRKSLAEKDCLTIRLQIISCNRH
jgi:hypothetical protein